MDLKKMNLVELNAQEVEEVEGGCPPYSSHNPAPYLSHQMIDFFRGLLDAF
ncbi:hypothetical protein [Flavobacterium collinsii]|uniref:hypothetical protein n=1 Tax=Flavobacterium collinsii TaxID=1114861 RepID=UPI0021DFBB5A|nr:hypothetical protein [Flavobacterium collinsii]